MKPNELDLGVVTLIEVAHSIVKVVSQLGVAHTLLVNELVKQRIIDPVDAMKWSQAINDAMMDGVENLEALRKDLQWPSG